MLVTACAAHAASRADFSDCVEDLQTTASENGIAADVRHDVLANVDFRSSIVDQDRSQPEFVTTFGDYFKHRVTQQRIDQGKQLLKRHRRLFQRIYRDYGVPPRYLAAFWGLESNYGSHTGDIPVLDSLTTLACNDRRSTFFTQQLMAALHIIQQGTLSPHRMEGSWAGAMGNMQFMPTTFRKYAVDYDGDGRRDLWNSLPDALASAANYLQSIGWKQGWRWGREVRLPDDFAYAHTGRDQWHSLDAWRAAGVRDAFGRRLPGGDTRAALLVPAGHTGPAFLVYANFKVIMQWNHSESYALAVGRLADRLAGAASLQQLPPDGPPLRHERIATMQQRLNESGFESGPVDGFLGPSTRGALRRFQRAQGLIADGYPSQQILARLVPGGSAE